MIRAYEELVDFIAGGTTPAMIARYEASPAARTRVADLIEREKTIGLTPEEKADLDHYLQLEHLLRLAKARAQRNAGQ
ncbi:MAG: hypothetical protein KF847_13385 [Pirellulales bacterium]|nr:hypothetical protein [Pirellulales bacterium]